MTEHQDPKDRKTESKVPQPSTEGRVINAHDLFQGAREVWLELDGVRYRLRITRRNNLMLDR